MGLPWSTADTSEEDVGHALEGTAFQGVSVFVIPRNILGAPRGVDTGLNRRIASCLGTCPGIWT